MPDARDASDPVALREERNALGLALEEIRATEDAVRGRLAALEQEVRDGSTEGAGADIARLHTEAAHLAERAEHHTARLAELEIAIPLAEVAAARAKAVRRERRRRSPWRHAFRIVRLTVLLLVLGLVGGYAYLARAGSLPGLLRPETLVTLARTARGERTRAADLSERPAPQPPSDIPLAEPTPVEEIKRDPERIRRITAAMQEDLRRRTTQGAQTQPPNTGETPKLDPNIPVVSRLTRGDAPDLMDLGPFLNAQFHEPEIYPFPEELKPFTVAGADINGDGTAEIVVLEFTARRVLVYERQADGYVLRTAAAVDPWPQQLAAADLNGDGWDDLVVPGGSSRSTILYGQPDWALAYQLVTVNWGASVARIGDMTGDGLPDILVGNAKELVLIPNMGTGIAEAGVVVQRGEFGVFGVGDLDGDGGKDVIGGPWIAWGREPESVSIGVALLGRDGSLAHPVSRMSYTAPIWRYAPVRRASELACDVVATVAKTNDVLLFRNHGDGTFEVERLAKARAGHSIIVFDIDRDGSDDALVGDRIFVHEGGDLVPRARFPGLRGMRQAGLADFDGDGESDLLINLGGRFAVYPRRSPHAPETDEPARPPGEAMTAQSKDTQELTR